MESNIAKAQKEVWEMKESLYEEIKDLPQQDRLVYIRQKVKQLMDERFDRKRVKPHYH